MAVGVLFSFSGVSQEQYDQVCRGLNNGQPLKSLADWPTPGCLSHVAGPTPDGGWHVFDVWESEEAFGRFAQQLMPLAQQAGLPDVQPELFQVYNFVKE